MTKIDITVISHHSLSSIHGTCFHRSSVSLSGLVHNDWKLNFFKLNILTIHFLREGTIKPLETVLLGLSEHMSWICNSTRANRLPLHWKRIDLFWLFGLAGNFALTSKFKGFVVRQKLVLARRAFGVRLQSPYAFSWKKIRWKSIEIEFDWFLPLLFHIPACLVAHEKLKGVGLEN